VCILSRGKSGSKHGGKRVERGYAKKETREEEESLDTRFHGHSLLSYCKIKGLSALRLKLAALGCALIKLLWLPGSERAFWLMQ